MRITILLAGILLTTCLAEARATYRSKIDFKLSYLDASGPWQVLVENSNSLSIVYSIDDGQPTSCEVVYQPPWKIREVLMNCEFTFHKEENGEGIVVLETSFDYELVINRLVDRDFSDFILYRWPYDYFLVAAYKKQTQELARSPKEALQYALMSRTSGFVYYVVHQTDIYKLLKINMKVYKSRRVWF